jgi:methylglutaconyl-CoA hydratase
LIGHKIQNSTMTEAYVKQDIQNGIATIEFFHPEHNSLPAHLLAQLVEVITHAGNDAAVKVIVLKSGGDRTFCAGASFKELVQIKYYRCRESIFLWFCQCYKCHA